MDEDFQPTEEDILQMRIDAIYSQIMKAKTTAKKNEKLKHSLLAYNLLKEFLKNRGVIDD